MLLFGSVASLQWYFRACVVFSLCFCLMLLFGSVASLQWYVRACVVFFTVFLFDAFVWECS